MGEIVGAGLLAHVPTIVLPDERPPRPQQRQGEHALQRACTSCAARCSTY